MDFLKQLKENWVWWLIVSFICFVGFLQTPWGKNWQASLKDAYHEGHELTRPSKEDLIEKDPITE